MSSSCVRVQALFEGVTSLEINRPEALNALNVEVLSELSSQIELIKNDENSVVVILKGAGEKAFVAGADIKEMVHYSQDDALKFSRLGQTIFAAIRELPQIVIAQVQGFALGGGLELALAADFILASQKSKFGLPEVGLGLIPGFGGTQRLVQRLGYSRALEWMTSAERFSADVAYQHGLLNRVVEHEQLATTVEVLARQIAAQGPRAVRCAKRAAQSACDAVGNVGFAYEAQLFASCFSSQESREGLDAFITKRKPEFRVRNH